MDPSIGCLPFLPSLTFTAPQMFPGIPSQMSYSPSNPYLRIASAGTQMQTLLRIALGGGETHKKDALSLRSSRTIEEEEGTQTQLRSGCHRSLLRCGPEAPRAGRVSSAFEVVGKERYWSFIG